MITPRRFHSAALALLSLALPAVAQAQAHQTRSGPCTLRSSTVESQSIPEEMARSQGFVPAADLAIVNVTVTCKGRGDNGSVPADVRVTKADLVGTKETVPMHQDRQNGYVSYTGSYHHLAGQVVKLSVSAKPEGTGRQLTLAYRQRFAAR